MRMGITDAGIFGDILVARMAKRGVAGARHRRRHARRRRRAWRSGLPVWCAGAAAPPSVAGLTFVGWQEPIGCGGVAVFPDDIIVADDDGAVVIPQALVDEVAKLAAEQERYETWAVERGREGRAAARPLSAQRGHQGALRGRDEGQAR